MKRRLFVILAVAIAPCLCTPDDIDDFTRMSSSLSDKMKSTDIKITEKNTVRQVEMKSQTQDSDKSAFISSFLHQGNNLFFKPQILLGSTINNPKPEENKEEPIASTPGPTSALELIEELKDIEESNELKVNVVNDEIPPAPVLPPLEMPKLPEIVIVKEPCPPIVPLKELVFREETLVIPEPPAIMPFNAPVEILIPKPVPHVPSCLMSNDPYGITIPCPPTVVYSPEMVDVDRVVERKTIIASEPSALFPLPKISLGAVFGRPVKTVMPYSEGFVSTTRYLPSVGVSKFSFEDFDRTNLVHIQNGPYPEVLVEGFPLRRQRVSVFEEAMPVVQRSSSFSAFCAHNIALERVLPNIVVSDNMIEIPVRPVF